MPLTDAENVLIGAICGTADTTLLQSTNYWKNAQQQRLPFTMDPRVLYRGYTANVINNGFCVASQFFFNGVVRTALTGGSERSLSDTEKIGSGFLAGALSGIICGPIELMMIQQQRKGGSLGGTAVDVVKGGPGVFFRGTTGMCLREGIYCGGYLGIVPVVREYITTHYKESIGKTEDSARLAATMILLLAPTGHAQDVHAGRCRADQVQGVRAERWVAHRRTRRRVALGRNALAALQAVLRNLPL